MAVSYDYYKIFYYVCQCRSFTKAAEALGNNQPNITRCINNLEEELGCKLFARSNRGVSLTPEGERLYRRVAVACEQLQIGEDEVRQDGGLETGVVSIASSAVPLHLLLDKLALFRVRYPGVKLRLISATMAQAVKALRQGQVDCALITTPVEPVSPLRMTPLVPFRDVLLCGPRYRELSEEVHSLTEWKDWPLIGQGLGSSGSEFYRRLFSKYGLPFHVDVEVSTQDQILPLVRCGLGLGFLAEQVAAAPLARGEIFQIRLQEEIPERFVCLVEDGAGTQSLAFKALRKEFLSGLDGR